MLKPEKLKTKNYELKILKTKKLKTKNQKN